MTAACNHAALKADPALWAALPFVGFQYIPADESGPVCKLEIRNCGECHSSLCVDVSLPDCRRCEGNGQIGVESRTSFAVDSETCPACDGDGVEAQS